MNVKANTSDLEKYYKKDEDLIMTHDIDMKNNRILNIADPTSSNEPVTLSLMTDMTTHFLDLKGSRKMIGNIQMDGHQVSGLTNFPQNDDHGANKKYVDDQISKANIKPTNIPKNAFKYIMESTNEWSVEYNLIINSFSDLNESPHSYNKKVLNITPKKTNFHYRFRFGIQVFPVDINTPYTLCVEILNRDYITWGRTQIFIEGLGIWLRKHNTVKYQHHYESNGDIYYHRTIINFDRTSSSGPSQVFYTVHYDNRGGDLDTYPDQFKDQIYVRSYGCKGNFNNIDSLVYDKHDAYELDNTKMKMLVNLDMNNKSIINIGSIDMNHKSIKNIGNISNDSIITLFGSIKNYSNNVHFFNNESDHILALKNVKIKIIKIYTSNTMKKKSDIIIIYKDNTTPITQSRFPFNHSSGLYTIIHIDQFFTSIKYITLSNGYNMKYELAYSLFY